MPKIKANQLTRDFFTERGYRIEMVERFNAYSGKRNDLLGCIDYLAMAPGKKIVGIQSFTSGWSEHERKIIKEWPEELIFWLSLKNTSFWFIGWRRLKLKRGGKAYRVVPRLGKVKLKKGKLILIETARFTK